MLKHTNQPSVSPWQQGNNGNGEITINCGCFPTWKKAVIRIHGKLLLYSNIYIYVCCIN